MLGLTREQQWFRGQGDSIDRSHKECVQKTRQSTARRRACHFVDLMLLAKATYTQTGTSKFSTHFVFFSGMAMLNAPLSTKIRRWVLNLYTCISTYHATAIAVGLAIGKFLGFDGSHPVVLRTCSSADLRHFSVFCAVLNLSSLKTDTPVHTATLVQMFNYFTPVSLLSRMIIALSIRSHTGRCIFAKWTSKYYNPQ